MTYRELWRRLRAVSDDDREAQAMARLVMEEGFGLTMTDIVCGKEEQLPEADIAAIIMRLLRHEPVQYVLGKTTYCGREFRLSPDVLIPRPETQQLNTIISTYCTERGTPCAILDIGTGSGCIAITASLSSRDDTTASLSSRDDTTQSPCSRGFSRGNHPVPRCRVTGWDISEEALRVARLNAACLGADVTFVLQDALHPPHDQQAWDVIVSNPPYVCHEERAAMNRRVTDYEPAVALFVPDNDPLLFYRAIAGYAREALRPGGLLAVEVNQRFASNTLGLFNALGFSHTAIHRDLFDRERFVTGLIP